jgi:hypothetical protein
MRSVNEIHNIYSAVILSLSVKTLIEDQIDESKDSEDLRGISTSSAP